MVTKGWIQPFVIFFPQKGPILAVKQAIYMDGNKRNQMIPAMKSKGRTVLCRQAGDTFRVGSGMKLYGEIRAAFTVKG